MKQIPSGGTRLKLLTIIGTFATAAWLYSIAGFAAPGHAVSYADWSGTMTWLFTAYGLTEVGAKGATAYLNK